MGSRSYLRPQPRAKIASTPCSSGSLKPSDTNRIASKKFDFPDPFLPTKIVNGLSSTSQFLMLL